MPVTRNHSTLQLKFYSLNAKDLNTSEKRSQALGVAWSPGAHAVFFQGIHFRSDAIPRLADRNYTQVFYATTPISKSKGVSVLILGWLPYMVIDTLINLEGR